MNKSLEAALFTGAMAFAGCAKPTPGNHCLDAIRDQVGIQTATANPDRSTSIETTRTLTPHNKSEPQREVEHKSKTFSGIEQTCTDHNTELLIADCQKEAAGRCFTLLNH